MMFPMTIAAFVLAARQANAGARSAIVGAGARPAFGAGR
jgi:hypothetical protein